MSPRNIQPWVLRALPDGTTYCVLDGSDTFWQLGASRTPVADRWRRRTRH